MQNTLIDIGVNLSHRSFREDRDEVIQRAVDAGVSGLILTGTCEKSSKQALQLAKTHPDLMYSTAGVHPHDAKECGPDTISYLKTLAKHPQVVAIGECGLDFNRDFSPRPDQEKWFEEQIKLACELKLPLFLHERDAHDRFLAILAPYRDQLVDAVVHCFTGTRECLKDYLDLDLHIGITGWVCDERRGMDLRKIVSMIPPHRLMVETDAPFLTPRDLRPKPKKGRNEPAFLPHILNSIAECRGDDAETLAKQCTDTTLRFFRLPTTPQT